MRTCPHVRLDAADGVLALTLARAEKKNALTGEMYDALADAFGHATLDPSIRIVLLEADGADFCAGNDIADFMRMTQATPGQGEWPVVRFLHVLARFEKPLVVAVRGRAVGIGTTMLLHADLVYLAEDAKLSVPFVNLALVPEAASSVLLPARVGHARAFAMFALGEPVDGLAAVNLGLANAAVPASEVSARARAAALALAAKPAQALQATKKLMREPGSTLAVIEAETQVFRERLMSSEAQAVFRAFLAPRGTRA